MSENNRSSAKSDNVALSYLTYGVFAQQKRNGVGMRCEILRKHFKKEPPATEL